MSRCPTRCRDTSILVFPGLGACFCGILGTKAGMVIVRDLADPDRMRRLGVDGLRRFVARPWCGPPAPQGRTAPRGSRRSRSVCPPRSGHRSRRCSPPTSRSSKRIAREIRRAEDQLAAVLAATPAGVLVSLPGVGVVRASAYGAAIGDPARFPNAGAAYRASGLVPAEYSSAGRRRGGQRSAGKDPSSSARRSSSSAAASPATTPTSPPTGDGCAATANDPRSLRSPSATAPTASLRHAPRPTALRPEPMGRRGGGQTVMAKTGGRPTRTT